MFSVEQEIFGVSKEVDLIPDGKNIIVTNDNKLKYVEAISMFKMYNEVQEQTDAFLEGFYEIIPKELIQMFNYKELELLISGLPTFSIEDLKANTEFQGYSPSDSQVIWLWEILEIMDNEERAKFL